MPGESAARRYVSAWALAEDLRRFRQGQPIAARPIGPLERVGRWCRARPLITLLLAVTLTLVGALVATAFAYQQSVLADVKQEAEIIRQQAQIEHQKIEIERQKTEIQRQRAELEKQQIIELHLAIGIKELENGDTYRAVLHFTEALRQHESRPENERSKRPQLGKDLRTRIATALRQCPHLTRFYTCAIRWCVPR